MTDRPYDRPEVSHHADPLARPARDGNRVWVPWSEIELPEDPGQPVSHGTTEHPSGPDHESGEPDSPEAGGDAQGWAAPEITDHPDRPDLEAIHLESDRRTHILDGDANGKGGGHRHGTGRPGKTEFPARWDDDTVCAYIIDVAHNPDDAPHQQDDRRWRCTGARDGVEVVVIVWPEGKIWASWPLPGGDGVAQNPKEA